MPFYRDLTFWMYALPCALYCAFVFFYATRSPWRLTAVGRAVMTQTASLAAVFFYICLVLAVPFPEGIKDTLRAVLIGGVTIGGALMLKSLLVEQGKRRNSDGKVP